jgi:phosphoglycolate phosphatase-like HAD superfamily hydrolase
VEDVILLPDALALDFDGVLCNGLKEYFQVSLKAYSEIWPEHRASPTWEPLFGRLRPVVETGWEMPLVLKAIQEGYDEANILLDWPHIRAELLGKSQLTPKQLNDRVDSLRDRWIAEDLSGWLALHEFYPSVSEQLQGWVNSGFPVFIITTKESRFVDALLRQNGVELSAAVIFGKDRQQPKTGTLRQLQAQGWTKLWFVEDRFETLKGIRTQPDLDSVALFLGDWGYNMERERQEATAHRSIHLLSLDRFTQSLKEWLS